MLRDALFILLPTILMVSLTPRPSDAVNYCSNPIPGTRKMIRGVDITKVDLVPLEFIAENGLKSPVVDFTCDLSKQWQANSDSPVYEMPDQVWQAYTIPSGWLTNSVKIYKSSSDIKRSMKNNVGGDGSIWKFAFSASHSYKTMQDTITNSSRYIEDVTAFESAIKVDLHPRWMLNINAPVQVFLNLFINGTYATNPNAYQAFIDEFGTHYFSSGHFGGYIRVVHETNENYFYQKSEREAETNARASFLDVISAHGGHVSGSTTVSTSFSSVTSKTIHYYGGSTNLLSQNNGLSQWQPTVDNDPWLFSCSLKPISDLIRDDVKKASMVEAVSQHVMRKYLEELQRLVTMGKSKISNSVLNSLGDRLNTMKGLKTLVEADVEALGNAINEQLTVPAWFYNNVQLCYKWRPDGDGGQCGGGAGRLLCAKPNAMTSVYRDDTDGRGGGCRMQWGIQAAGIRPHWFNQVKVCYRWYPDGDGGQCGGGAARELCANINGYSPEYRDDTDGRGGGCRMSWRIVVPASAPLWMQTSKMCFSWYPDGDGGQCGGGASRNLCASANRWTPYYRDDTDGRGGGCRMSWGIKLEL